MIFTINVSTERQTPIMRHITIAIPGFSKDPSDSI